MIKQKSTINNRITVNCCFSCSKLFI